MFREVAEVGLRLHGDKHFILVRLSFVILSECLQSTDGKASLGSEKCYWHSANSWKHRNKCNPGGNYAGRNCKKSWRIPTFMGRWEAKDQGRKWKTE